MRPVKTEASLHVCSLTRAFTLCTHKVWKIIRIYHELEGRFCIAVSNEKLIVYDIRI